MKILITGGAGFIGINATAYFLKKKYEVTIFDNFSRKGGNGNIAWIKKQKYSKSLRIVRGDILNDINTLNKEISRVDVVLHLAGQVAVTTSVLDPVADCHSNVLGAIHVLEAARKSKHPPIFLYSSTNKVYGGLEDVPVKERVTRYEFANLKFGIPETRGVDFHSPYGCSKGAADQYVRDYYRIYGLPTVVFRQSCIYGPHQYGVEDQGWVAWFMIALLQNKKLTIFGTGKQVRDLLYVDDLIEAYYLALTNIRKTRGQIYNIGGGVKNTLSIWYEFQPILEKLFHRTITAKFSKARPGDQPIYISDIRKAYKDFGWKPKTSLSSGMRLLYNWIQLEHI